MDELIKEYTWNLCKQFAYENHTRDKTRLKNFISTTIELIYGSSIENYYREDWQNEVDLFAKKYGYE